MGAAEARAAYQPDLLVRLASEGDATYVGEGVFEAEALTQTKSQPAFPGTAASFRVLLKNAGDAPDSFLIRGTASGAGFTVRYLDEAGVDRAAALAGAGWPTRQLLPGESLPLLVQVTPAAFQLGASYRVDIGAASATDATRVDQVKTETVSCGSSAAVTVSTPPDGSGAPGTSVSYPYTVTNVGSDTNSFTLSVTSQAGWQCAIYADDGAGGGIAGDGLRQTGENTPSASTGPLAPGAGYRFFVAVTIPAASSDGARGDATLSVAGQGASATDQVATSAIPAVITVAESVRNLTQGGAFAASASALPGDTLQYRMAVTNSGSAPAAAMGILAQAPGSTTCLPDSLWIGTASDGTGSPCPVASCGTVRLAADGIVARLGEGASADTGGSLAAGKTIYVFFRVQVE